MRNETNNENRKTYDEKNHKQNVPIHLGRLAIQLGQLELDRRDWVRDWDLKLQVELVLGVLVKVPARALPSAVDISKTTWKAYERNCQTSSTRQIFGAHHARRYLVPVLLDSILNQSLSISLLILMYSIRREYSSFNLKREGN